VSDTLEKYVYPAIDAIRDSVEHGERIEKSPSTQLYGEGAPLTSLDVVTFVIEVEERVASETGKAIRLVSPSAMSRKNSPFRTFGTLADYIDELLREAR
jgi:hypothetical protein